MNNKESSTQSPVFSLDIHALSHDGRGIGTLQGKTTFVSGVMPGEKILCKISRKHHRYNEAQVIEILAPSPERTQPHCAHFGVCGGCSLQHFSKTTQLHMKQKTLLEQLQHFGKVTPTHILEPLSGPDWGYRRKARLGVRYVIKKEKLMVGFREKSGRYLVDVQECPVLHPSVGLRIKDLGEVILSLEQFQHIPQIEVAVGDQATALVFRHLVSLPDADIHKLKTFCETQGFHLYLQPNTPARVHKVWPEDQNERLTYTLPEHHIEMRFHPLDFTQINQDINQLMLKQALQLLDPQKHESILDLFCGIGNFTLPIARYAAHVTGIEGDSQMVERARENAFHNQIDNAEFFATNLQNLTGESAWMHKHYDKILLDPARPGAKEIISLLARLSPSRILYVSCNPATLARDAGDLVHHHAYHFTNVGIMNMFPHTSHIEAIAVFEKT